MKDAWDNKEFAKEWDEKSSKLNATRAEHLDIIVSILVDNYKSNSFILDIGSGSGQIEDLILERNHSIKIVCVDSARPMIEMAQERLSRYKDNFQVVEKDITKLELSDLPKGDYDYVFSCQVTHELPSEEKIKLFKKVYELLQPLGSFLVMDRIKVDYELFNESYRSILNRLGRLMNRPKSYEKFYQSFSDKEDFPASEEEYLSMLRLAGFKVATLHLHLDRAIMVGVKTI